jgi:hypothetical protein
MNWEQLFNRLYLHEEGALDQQVNHIPLLNPHPFVLKRQFNLAFILKTLELQLSAKAAVIAGFEQARA